MTQFPIAAQLYCVREACKQNFSQALKQVAAIGYRAVELAGLHGHSPTVVKQMTADCGLAIISSHVGLSILEADLDKVMDEHELMGCHYIAVPIIPKERLLMQQGWLNAFQTIEALAQRCQVRGLTLMYHNHAYEFATQINGRAVLDVLFERAPHVQSELDVYWLWKAGVDPAAYLARFKGRAPMLHVKDADKRDGSFAAVGSGQLNWNGILDAARTVGVQGYIVEWDDGPGSPFDCLKQSFDFLQTQGFQ